MAIFSFECPEHGEFSAFLDRGVPRHTCPKCRAESKRILKSSPAHVKEVIDNGIMHKSIERFTDVDELMRERNAAHKKSIKQDS